MQRQNQWGSNGLNCFQRAQTSQRNFHHPQRAQEAPRRPLGSLLASACQFLHGRGHVNNVTSKASKACHDMLEQGASCLTKSGSPSCCSRLTELNSEVEL